MNNKIGFGILGCGVVSNYHTAAIIELSDRAYISGVADINPTYAEIFAKKYGINAFKSYDEMLADEKTQVVCICTPSGFHADALIKAVKAGKHVLVEKPLAINAEQLEKISEVCSASDSKVGCILQSRFYRSVKKVKAAIDEGLLGKLLCADIYMKYFRSQEYYNSSAWRGTISVDGGGALMNQGIHGVDLLLYMAGAPKSVTAFSKTLVHDIEAEDTLVCCVEFKNGALGVIEAATSVYPGYPRLLNLHGERGTISLEENSIFRWDIKTDAAESDIVISTTHFSGASSPTAISPDGHLMQFDDMINAVINNKMPTVDWREGKKCVEFILAVYKSAAEKRTVYFD